MSCPRTDCLTGLEYSYRERKEGERSCKCRFESEYRWSGMAVRDKYRLKSQRVLTTAW